MRYLIRDVYSGNVVASIYRDPPAEPGTVQDALSNTLLSQLDLAPMPEAEADRVLGTGARCTFNRSPESEPILWAAQGGGGAAVRSEEHTSELQSLMRISYAVFCLKKKTQTST